MLSRSPSPTRPAGFIAPCLPTLSLTVPDGPRWAFEVKHDGFRFICRRDGDRVRVFSRNGRDWTDRVPSIVEAMRNLPLTSAALDGEGVVVDERGLTDFERLRTALAGRGGSRRVFLYGFDLLAARWPRSAARAVGNPPRYPDGAGAQGGPGIRLSEHLDGDGETIFRHACALGAEGVVASGRTDQAGACIG
jgi:bifunctional non-homologous end joining protein LigD